MHFVIFAAKEGGTHRIMAQDYMVTGDGMAVIVNEPSAGNTPGRSLTLSNSGKVPYSSVRVMNGITGNAVETIELPKPEDKEHKGPPKADPEPPKADAPKEAGRRRSSKPKTK